MRLEAQPDRLTAASERVRGLGHGLGQAGLVACRAFDEVAAGAPGSLTAAAAAELAVEAAAVLRTVCGGVQTLAGALGAAAWRYADADILR